MDGYLDYGEFVAISVHLRNLGKDEGHLRRAFEFFDRNQSEYIEVEELQDAFGDEVDTNSEEVINGILKEVDTDKVCQIDLTVLFAHIYLLILFYAK